LPEISVCPMCKGLRLKSLLRVGGAVRDELIQ